MPPQNQPTPNQTPETPEGAGLSNNPEKQIIPPGVGAETAPKPTTPETPATEIMRDQGAPAPVQNTPNEPPVTAPAAGTVTPPIPPVTEDDEAASGVEEMDKSWVKTVDTVIENDKDKPYEEEEDSEKLQIDYLSKRFGKKIDKE